MNRCQMERWNSHQDSQRTDNQYFININIRAFVASFIFGVDSTFNI